MKMMLKAGFKEQWNQKGESQTYWVFQFLKEWLKQKRQDKFQNDDLTKKYPYIVIDEFLEELNQ